MTARSLYSSVSAILLSVVLCACGARSANPARSREAAESNSAWKGKWQRNIRMNEGNLEITGTGEDSLSFTLLATSGGNVGVVDGKILVSGRKARYTVEDCDLVFTLMGDSAIDVEQKDGLCFAGLGVTYSGSYINEKMAPAQKDVDLYDLGMLPAKADSQLRALTGKDYDLFLKSTQLTSEDEDLDKVKAKVLASGVRGLFSTMENMIMYTDKGDIWAAVINMEKDSVFKDKLNGKVYYYTNRADYANRLPATIDRWRSRFKDYEVKYKSAKQP